MEIKIYTRILLKRWRLILAGFLVVFLSALFLTFRQPYIYEAQATFVMRPRSEFIVDDEFVRALDVVSRRVEINTTFAEVVGSKLIKNQAIESLDLSTQERQDLSVSGRVIGGTNILEITAEGRSPTVVRDFTNAVGAQTVDYVASLYDVFELEPLDEASAPRSPVKPNPTLNLMLGAIFGLVLGSGLAFLLEYLERPHKVNEHFNIIDRESGAYNKTYLMHRLWQEISRAKRNKCPLAIGMIRVEIGDTESRDANYSQAEALRLVKILVAPLLRREDIIARFDNNTLAILLVEMTEPQARSFMEELNLGILSVPQDVGGQNGELVMNSTVSAVSYDNNRMKQSRFMEQVIQGLEEAVFATNGKEKVAANNHVPDFQN